MKADKICKHEGCSNEAAFHRRECNACKKNNNSINVTYHHLKKSAKKRDIKFTITFPWFKEWISTTDYMEKKGLLGSSLTIDRIENHLGYEKGNLRILTRSRNSSKGNRLDLFEELGQTFTGPIPF